MPRVAMVDLGMYVGRRAADQRSELDDVVERLRTDCGSARVGNDSGAMLTHCSHCVQPHCVILRAKRVRSPR